MGLCNKCREIYPPTLMFATENGEQICAFCKTGRDSVTLEGEGFDAKVISKQEAIAKYREFIRNVMKRDELKKLLVKDDGFKL